jgi:hypothetical protein
MRRLVPDGFVKWRNVIATLVVELAREGEEAEATGEPEAYSRGSGTKQAYSTKQTQMPI